MRPAALAWEALEEPWRLCLELAWEAFQAGSVPVGAVVVDGDGRIVARGRNRMAEREAPPGQLAGSTVAHAEVNALAGLRLGDHSGLTLFSSLEPCLQCAGAIVLAGVPRVRWAAADALFAGLHGLPSLNPYVATRWPLAEGPLVGPFGDLALLLPAIFSAFWFPGGGFVDTNRAIVPGLVDLAEELVATGDALTLASRDLADALELLWHRLSSR